MSGEGIINKHPEIRLPSSLTNTKKVADKFVCTLQKCRLTFMGPKIMQWQEIIEFLGGATVFGVVIAYLGKTGIDAFVSGRTELYKKDLERIAAEHAVRFQRLQSERERTS